MILSSAQTPADFKAEVLTILQREAQKHLSEARRLAEAKGTNARVVLESAVRANQTLMMHDFLALIAFTEPQ